MPKTRATAPQSKKLHTEPVTAARWGDLATLFGKRGACGGCWCMWWRLPRARYERQKGAGNRRALRRLAGGTRAPGLLAYRGIDPIGWCAVGPREDFLRLAGARVLRPIDDERVWTVTCLFVAREARGRRVSVALLRGAARFAAAHGARILEGYPVDTRGRRTADVFIAMGTLSCFRDAGFREVARASPVRPVMRRRLRGS